MEEKKVYDKIKKPKIDLNVTYQNIFDSAKGSFESLKRLGESIEVFEGFEEAELGHWWNEYEISRLMYFISIAYCEIKYANTLTEELRNQMKLDIPVWDSGKVDKFLSKEDKEQLYPHLQIIKDYINKTNQDN